MRRREDSYAEKALIEEQKARDAEDDAGWSCACLAAAQFWERAAELEAPGELRTEYERNAARDRWLAEGGRAGVAGLAVDPNGPDSKSTHRNLRALN